MRAIHDCVFCKIVSKQLPAAVVYEDEQIVAFGDINPVAPVHVLVIPKQHLASLKDDAADEQILGALLVAAKKVALDHGLEGYRVVINTGKDGGQAVDHLHLHVIGGKPLSPEILA